MGAQPVIGNHKERSRRRSRRRPDGHSTFTVVVPRRISSRIRASDLEGLSTARGMERWASIEGGSALGWGLLRGAPAALSASTADRRSGFAFTDHASATAAIDTPGWRQAATASALNSARCRRRRRRSIIMVFTCPPRIWWTRMLLPLGFNGKVGSPDAHLGCSPDSAHMSRPSNMGGNSRRCSAEPLSSAAPASAAWRRGLSTAAAKCTRETTDGCRTQSCGDGFSGYIRRSRP